ncbi:LPS export ABC transporter permease LptG [Phaeovulum sp.]|uniref:LPS export ABC transporter permease LptG n=1 Tax=Phaeovulum sp. TaxID=2934796 RepID=UPI0039E3D554
MTLWFYIARRFLRSFLMVMAIFFCILFLIDMVEQIRRFDADQLGLGGAALLAALGMPGALYTILPLIMVLAAVTLFLGLARSSELVVIRASGRSALAMLIAPVTTALVLGALAVAVGNPLVAATDKRAEELSARFRAGEAQAVSIGREGVWLRQGGGLAASDTPNGHDATQAVIRAARGNQDATVLYDVTFLIFAPGKGPIRRIFAKEARLGAGKWVLTDVKDWPLATAGNPEREATHSASLTLPSDLTADRIRDGFGAPSAVSIWALPDFIAGLQRAGFSTRRHMVWLQMELALPFVLAAMVLIAAGFTMRHARFGRTGQMVLLALAAGLGVFFLRNVAQVLGDNGQIPVMLAAWAPPGIALMLSIALLLHLEDG